MQRAIRRVDAPGVAVWLSVVVLAILPLLVCLVYMAIRGYWPGGDDAYIGVRTMDVWSTHPPLTGMRSTGYADAGAVQVHHPGPLQFYVLAVPFAVSAFHTWGLLFGAFVLATYVVWVGVRAAYGMWRLPGVLVVGGSFVALESMVGLQFLLQPWNPTTALLPVLALAVLLCAMWAGRLRWMPHLAFVWSYIAQAHLAYLPLIAVSGAVLAVGGIVRWRRMHGQWWPLLEGERERGFGRGWATVVVFAACWLPVAVEAVLYAPDNITQILRYLTTSHGATVGPGRALAVTSTMAAPTADALRGLVTTSGTQSQDVNPIGLAVLAIVAAAVGTAAVRWGHGHPDVFDRLLLVLGGMLLVTLVTVSRIEQTRSLVYALVFAPVVVLAAVTAVTSLARGALRSARPARRPRPSVLVVLVPVALVAAVALSIALPTREPLTPTFWTGGDRTRTAAAQVARAARAADGPGGSGGSRTVRIVAPGPVGILYLAGGIGYGLSREHLGWTKDFYWTLPTDDARHEDANAPRDALVLTIRERVGGRWSGPVPQGRLIHRMTWPATGTLPPEPIELYLR